MFERYTEKARRVIFFGRFAASEFGSPYIETEHLLLGVLREDAYVVVNSAPEERRQTLREELRRSIYSLSPERTATSTSVDLPLSNESKRVLAYASEEAERLQSNVIGSEHLFLGLLREERSAAARILNDHGITLAVARTKMEPAGLETPPGARPFPPVDSATEGHLVFVDSATNAKVGSIELFEALQVPRIGESVWLGDSRKFVVMNVRYEFLRKESSGTESTLKLSSIVVSLHRTQQNPMSYPASPNEPLSST